MLVSVAGIKTEQTSKQCVGASPSGGVQNTGAWSRASPASWWRGRGLLGVLAVAVAGFLPAPSALPRVFGSLYQVLRFTLNKSLVLIENEMLVI